MVLPLSSALLRPHLHCWLQFWDPQYGKNMEVPERVQQRAGTKMKGLEHLFCKEKLGGLFKPGEGKVREGFVDGYKFMKGRYKEDRTKPFSVMPRFRTRGSGTHKHRRFCLSTGKHFLNCESDGTLALGVQGGCGLLEIFRSCLDTILGNGVLVALLEQRGQMASTGPFSHSVIPLHNFAGLALL